MFRIVVLAAVLASVVPAGPATAQDCFPYDTTTRFAATLGLDSSAVCVVADGDLAFIVTANRLVCADMTDPAQPTVLGQVVHGIVPACATVMGDFVVIGTPSGLRIVDVSDPAAPVVRGSAAVPQPVEALAACGDLLLAATGNDGLRIFTVSAAGGLQPAGAMPTYFGFHGVAALGPHRALVASGDTLLDLDLTDPQTPVVLQESRPARQREFLACYLGLRVDGDWAAVAIAEATPVGKVASRDEFDAHVILLLDLAAPDPDDLVAGYWVGDWTTDIVLDDVRNGRVIAHDGTSLLVFPLAAPAGSPATWAPLTALAAEGAIGGAALAGGGIAVGLSSGSLRTLGTTDPVAVPTLASFAPGEETVCVGPNWAYSLTPHGYYEDNLYLYSLWDLRDPRAPQVVDTVQCQDGFDPVYECDVVAASGDLVLRSEWDRWVPPIWTLQDWSSASGTSVPLPITREGAVFAGTLLLGLGHDRHDYPAPSGIQVVDAADPAAPVVRGFLAQAVDPYGAGLVRGDRWLTAVHAPNADSLVVIDLSDPDAPRRADVLALAGRPTLLRAFGDLVVGADAGGDLWVFGLDPLRAIGHLAGAPDVVDVAVDGDIAWVLWDAEGLVAVDLADPGAPVRRGTCAVSPESRGLVVAGGVVYMAGGPLGVQAYDASDPDAPVWLGGGGAAANAVFDRGDCLLVPGAATPLDCRSLMSAPDVAAIPAAAAVSAWPNPFNPRTVIAYDVTRDGPAEVAVFDLRGRRVCELWHGELVAGHHEVTWEGADDAGRAQPSGVYLVRLRTDQGTTARKITLAR